MSDKTPDFKPVPVMKFRHFHPDGSEIPAKDAKTWVNSRKARVENRAQQLITQLVEGDPH